MHGPDERSTRVPVADTEAAFDAFDEDAQVSDAAPESREGSSGASDEHGHVAVSTVYAPTTGKGLRIFVGLLAVVLSIGFFVANHFRRGQEASLREEAALRVQQPPPVEVVKVQRRSAKQTLVLPGETRGWYSSTIYARVTGYVARWLVDIGDSVKKDQVMAIIDTPDLDAQLDAAQAQLNAAEAEAKVRDPTRSLPRQRTYAGRRPRKGRSPIRNVKTRRPVTTAASRSSTRPSPASTSIGRTSTACAI